MKGRDDLLPDGPWFGLGQPKRQSLQSGGLLTVMIRSSSFLPNLLNCSPRYTNRNLGVGFKSFPQLLYSLG